MQAMVYRRYGGPEVLQPEGVPTPEPAEDAVRVQVRAASLNSWDWELLHGTPWPNRIGGLRRPRYPVLGADVAGVVEACGARAARLRPGDAVFGDLSGCGWGGFAERVCAPESAWLPIPAGVDFAQAAALPQAAGMALQGVRDIGRVQPGQRVLVNGAGGGVGTYAVQLARAFGAHVTAVDRAVKLDAVRALGAEAVLDCAREDFTRGSTRYDLVLDMVAVHALAASRRVLTPCGRYVLVGGPMARVFQALGLMAWTALTRRRRVAILAARPNRGLAELGAMVAAGKLVPVIDRRYPLHALPEAMAYFGENTFVGKVVIEVG